MVWEHRVAMFSANDVSVFYMGFTINTQSYAKCTYMIGREHSHVVLSDYTSISHILHGSLAIHWALSLMICLGGGEKIRGKIIKKKKIGWIEK